MNDEFLEVLRDAYLSIRRVFLYIDRWCRSPVRGIIYVNGVPSMTTTDTTPTDIPDNDVPARVDWQDRLGESIPGANTTTSWSAEDENGQASGAVQIEADASNDEQATVHFSQGNGQFKLVATTTGADGNQVRAESGLYNITPGAPAVGTITLSPV